MRYKARAIGSTFKKEYDSIWKMHLCGKEQWAIDELRHDPRYTYTRECIMKEVEDSYDERCNMLLERIKQYYWKRCFPDE